jgi:hypothetical protein
MNRKLSHRERVEMIQWHEQGMSLGQIAQCLGVHRDTVKKWWRVYREAGWEGLYPKPCGDGASGPLCRFDPLVRYVALRLKREHPGWGPEVLLLAMYRRASLAGKRLPGRSALAGYLQPYLERLRHGRPRVLRRPAAPQGRVWQVHECWEIDFKGAEWAGACGFVAPLLVTEALTSAPLLLHILPAARAGMTCRDVQAALRLTFSEWGRPEMIRMDNDPLFIGSSRREWPGTLLLWLVGLGITPIINAPGKPTQNPHVERQGRTWKAHVLLGADCATREELQTIADQARWDRLLWLPSRNPACHGAPPLLVHPELAHTRRPFTPADEVALFDFERVELYLADWVLVRLVSKTGCISIADHNITIGKAYHRQAVEVTYDLNAHAFLVRTHDRDRSLLCHFSLDVVSPAYIIGLCHSDSPTRGSS